MTLMPLKEPTVIATVIYIILVRSLAVHTSGTVGDVGEQSGDFNSVFVESMRLISWGR